MSNFKTILNHPLTHSFSVSLASLGLFAWTPGFDPSGGAPSLQILIERCADVPTRSVSISRDAYQSALQVPPGGDPLPITGQTSFCRMSDRLFNGKVVTPFAYPVADSTTVLLLMYDQAGYVGNETWELPASSGNSHQVFAANVSGTPYAAVASEGKGIVESFMDLLFGPQQAQNNPAPPPYGQYYAEQSASPRCQ